MSELPPHAVLSEHFQERLSDRRLVSAVFLTYRFDPGFFEQEVLPVFLDVPLSHAVPIRLVQLDDAVRSLSGQVAVYYDAHGLVASDHGSRLDVKRIPIRHRPGVFHPKNVFLLLESEDPDEAGQREQSLVVAATSANITREGWWENVEACHVVDIAEGEKTRLRDDLTEFLRRVKRKSAAETDHSALDDILGFLKTTEQHAVRSWDDQLHLHFYSGGESLPDFLDRVAGPWIRGSHLEIISPYFDDDGVCEPLRTLVERFNPKDVRIYLPRTANAEGLCNESFYDAVRSMGAQWGRLPKDLLRLGTAEDAGSRFVHAKVYRFFSQSPKREIYFVGSANLTSAAHSGNVNVETGFLVDVVPERRPDYWLALDQRKPDEFRVRASDDVSAGSGTPLLVRYHWDRSLAEGFWDSAENSPTLSLVEARGSAVGIVGPLASRTWVDLGEPLTANLREVLKETSFLHALRDGAAPTLLLVQEEGMAQKPSLLVRLSAADILRYWSLLTAAQRAAFIEARAPELELVAGGADIVSQARLALEHDTLFDRFAGFFHAFGCLDRAVRTALESAGDREAREATYRLFGRKYDSLWNLLDRVQARDGSGDDVDRYVIVLCARQLCDGIRRDYPEFWTKHRDDAGALEESFAASNAIRERLTLTDPTDMPPFLDWFERWFLKRARPVEQVE